MASLNERLAEVAKSALEMARRPDVSLRQCERANAPTGSVGAFVIHHYRGPIHVDSFPT